MMGALHHRQESSVRLVPWGSWREWDCVRAALYSSSPSRVKAAIDRVAAWHSKGGVPIAVEITAELLSVHYRDPKIKPGIATKSILSEEMLRMMYAMAIMRLVNGVVDQSKRNTMSVAGQAEIACLPRMLVDIRHESAHNELPGISVLRLASKLALDWLEHRYWQQQREALRKVEAQMRSKLLEYLSLLKTSNLIKRIDSKRRHKGDKDEVMGNTRKAIKKLFNEILELSSSGVSDIVSILVDKCMLEQSDPLKRRKSLEDLIDDTELYSLQGPSETENENELEAYPQASSKMDNENGLMLDIYLQDTLCRLSIFMPQLLPRLLMRIVHRLLRLKGADRDNGCVYLHPERDETISSPISSLQVEESDRLISWLSWLLDDHLEKKSNRQKCSRERLSYTEEFEIEGGKHMLGELPKELLQEMLTLILKSSLDRDRIIELVSIFSMHMGPSCSEGKLSRLALLSKPLGAQGDGQDLQQARGKTNHKEQLIKTKVDENSSNDDALIDRAQVPDTIKLKTDELDVDFSGIKEQHRRLLRFSAHFVQPQELTVDQSSSPDQSSGTYRPRSKKRWRLADQWFPCAIGLLPSQSCASRITLPWLQSCTESLCVGDNGVACLPSSPRLDGTVSQVDIPHQRSLVKDTGQEKGETIDITEASDLNALQPLSKKERVILATFGESGWDKSIFDADKNTASMLGSIHGDKEDVKDGGCFEKLPTSVQGCVMQNGVFKPLSAGEILALQKEIRIW